MRTIALRTLSALALAVGVLLGGSTSASAAPTVSAAAPSTRISTHPVAPAGHIRPLGADWWW